MYKFIPNKSFGQLSDISPKSFIEDKTNITLSRRDMDLKSSFLVPFDKSNLLRKIHFLLESNFQVIASFVLLEIGYLVTIVVNVFCNEHDNNFWDITK